LHANT